MPVDRQRPVAAARTPAGRPADRRRERSRSAGPASYVSTLSGRVLDRGARRRGPRAAAAGRRPGTSTGRGARRPRPTRAGRPGRRRRGAGRRRSASRGRPSRVARRRIVSAAPARRFASAEAERVGCRHRRWPPGGPAAPRIRTTFRLRDERSSLPRCHPHSAMPHSRDRRAAIAPPPIGAARYRWRSAPEPTGAPRVARGFGPEAPGSIRRRRRPGFHQPPGLCAERATDTRPDHRPYS